MMQPPTLSRPWTRTLAATAAAAVAAAAAGAAQAATVAPTSYSMINGGGTASGGSFNYWDAAYSGSGATTTDGAFLSGGLGKLTDGIFATQRWDAVSNLAGTGEYIGWRDGSQANPLLTFTFAGSVTIDSIDIYIDNSQFGGVYAPQAIVVDGATRNVSAAATFPVLLHLENLGLSGSTHTVQFIQTPGTWTFVSEIVFNGSPVPEPATASLVGLGLLAFGVLRRRRG